MSNIFFTRDNADKEEDRMIKVVTFLLVIFILSWPIAFWTESNLQYWSNYFGKDMSISFWQAWIICVAYMFIQPFKLNLLGINLISEILELIF